MLAAGETPYFGTSEGGGSFARRSPPDSGKVRGLERRGRRRGLDENGSYWHFVGCEFGD